MDITGARWGFEGAEAELKLRAIRANADFDAYWRHNLAQERRRVHEARYAGVRVAVNNRVPFVVASIGFLAACRQR